MSNCLTISRRNCSMATSIVVFLRLVSEDDDDDSDDDDEEDPSAESEPVSSLASLSTLLRATSAALILER